jgi:hypothetical protein
MRLIFDRLARPFMDPALKGCWWRDHLLVVLDGSTLALQDTPSNDGHFGRSTNQHGKAAWPLARFVALAEAGTHLIFRAEIGRYNESEIVLAEKVVDGLKEGMLCLADRLFPGFSLWKKAAATGAHLLWRAKIGMKLKADRVLRDGSWVATWKTTARGLANTSPVTVRVIEYRLKGGDGQIFRLLTSLLDPEQADGAMAIHRPVRLWRAQPGAGETLSLALGTGRQGWIQLIDGAGEANGHPLQQGDGLGYDAGKLEAFTAGSGGADLLLFELC